MSTPHDPTQPIILAGMHRSGTSLAASIMQAAGIDVGERLLGADIGNARGHFEDLDFIDLHKKIFQSLSIHWNGWTTQHPLNVPENLRLQAQQLITQKQSRGRLWGWKDPRTTILLNFWHALLPNARYVFLFRPPWEVVDSLYRRATDIDVLDANPRLAVDYWLHYNQQAFHFARRHPERCLLISNDALVADPAQFVRTLAQKFQLTLTAPTTQLYDPTLMHRESSQSPWPAVFARLLPDTTALLAQLESLADLPSPPQSFTPATDDALDHLLINLWFQTAPSQRENWTLGRRLDTLELELYNRKQQTAQSEIQSAALETELHAQRLLNSQLRADLDHANRAPVMLPRLITKPFAKE